MNYIRSTTTLICFGLIFGTEWIVRKINVERSYERARVHLRKTAGDRRLKHLSLKASQLKVTLAEGEDSRVLLQFEGAPTLTIPFDATDFLSGEVIAQDVRNGEDAEGMKKLTPAQRAQRFLNHVALWNARQDIERVILSEERGSDGVVRPSVKVFLQNKPDPIEILSGFENKDEAQTEVERVKLWMAAKQEKTVPTFKIYQKGNTYEILARNNRAFFAYAMYGVPVLETLD